LDEPHCPCLEPRLEKNKGKKGGSKDDYVLGCRIAFELGETLLDVKGATTFIQKALCTRKGFKKGKGETWEEKKPTWSGRAGNYRGVMQIIFMKNDLRY